MSTRFYVDADLLGLGKLLVQVRSDVTYAGDPGGLGPDGLLRSACPIHVGDLDSDWLPRVAAQSWVIVTRDRHLRHRPAERMAILENGAKVIQLDARRELTKWDQLEIVVSQWRRFEELVDVPGPWLVVAGRTSLRRVELAPG